MDSDERAIAPEEAFSLLGNDTRIGIVRALWEADEPLSFSELHDRVGLRDSGQFNYHLNKLVGLFVRQKNGKYELPFAGHRVIGAILSGTYTHTGYPRRSNSIHGVSSVAGRWRPNTRRRWSRFAVPSCDERRSTFGFPPGAFEGRNVEDLPRTFERWLRNAFSVMADGICPNCSGRTVGSLVTDSEHLDDDQAARVEFVCERCGDYASGNVGTYLLQHPAVVAFHYDHGIDLGRDSAWELEWLGEDDARIVLDDPLLVEYTVELGGDELELTVDSGLNDAVEEM
ncbi:ArsR/SmtB family transcription factor [Haladaptatus halobius]|uniref:ArsR/SmtB family transcription factor n=1 Tax=Haladaptatus halobius TaxID=2884875 RepID=UPI001D0A0EBA|nr:helix-turn-helix domain-containing protein [Haladaptatus halobius]